MMSEQACLLLREAAAAANGSRGLAAPTGSSNRLQQQQRRRRFGSIDCAGTHLAVLPAHVLWAGVVEHAQLLVGVELEGSQDAIHLPLALSILQVGVKLLQAGRQAGKQAGRQEAERRARQGSRQAGVGWWVGAGGSHKG
jgi:hypothetical protein